MCVLDKRLFEVKRKDQLNALKNLVDLNDVNQQYKIIDIMLKGLFKVLHSSHPSVSSEHFYLLSYSVLPEGCV